MPNLTELDRYKIPVLAVICAAVTGFFMTVSDYDWQGLLLVAAAIGILAILVIPRMARAEGSFLLYVLIAGLLLRLGFSLIQWWVALNVYEGTADAFRYHSVGVTISQYIWNLEFGEVSGFLHLGTRFVEFFTGAVYSIIGPTRFGGYLFYGLLGFFGSYWFYRGFRIAFPQGKARLFALVIFFTPTILYWSNGISKDALIFLCLGLSAYGSALVTKSQLRGIAPLAFGLLGVIWIRPHIALVIVLALILAFSLRQTGRRTTHLGVYIISLALIIGTVWFLIPQITSYLGLGQLSFESIVSYIESRGMYTFGGGSSFQQASIFQPSDVYRVVITVLFRPFPWEVYNLQALFQSLEGILIAGLALWRIKSLGRVIVSSLSEPYLRYVLVMIIGFIGLFSTMGNFGILVRQRAMFLPFFFMLIAYSGLGGRIESKPKEVIAL